MQRIIYLLLLSFLSANSLAQEHKWVEAEGRASMEQRTQQEARVEALREARVKAVTQAGVTVQSDAWLKQYENTKDKKTVVLQDYFASVSREVAHGEIVHEEILFEAIVTSGMPPQAFYEVKIKTQVAVIKGLPDPAFNLQVKINKEKYKENETMTIDLWATKNCYIYIFNFLANDSILVLFPNRYPWGNNQLKAGTVLHLPPAGYSFSVSLLPGFQEAQELIYVVATKERYDFAPTWWNKNEGFQSTATEAFAFVELPRWLVRIPPDQRTNAVVQYEIYRPTSKHD